MPHRIVFTHGDLKHHNIAVQNGQITGFLDWESAGWCPEYRDFTTALRLIPKGYWWYNFVIGLGGSSYMAELDCEQALTSLTVDSYSGDIELRRATGCISPKANLSKKFWLI
ncbi:hypothetical protein BDBG_03511 [Blastomyces gilchristii SLH14081]|uniref:Aminoglycoside phosphotransferase domain-containing protein n=1 Tax=Blastomyces gilchristii (strain SLH14081) TaxID=559298 RepID=A0A179UKB5_BLAGS|nr:uncharacterized protein BDBG_03511 [Blastomyces gilchristii SLH14081]OAT07451.1 hypothetical protein BDBG_03511 [Blastomyces gilchristii SLH14081]